MSAALSVCMIVRDEEKDIGRCLESIQGIADEIIVVDTGSVDKTKAIASGYNAKIYDFEWIDDFSKARNYSIEKATGDWILILDGDDEFEIRDANSLKELINKNDAADIYIFNTICYIGEKAGNDKILNVNIRLFRNIPELRYQGRIHESVISQRQDIRIEPIGITVYHYGYLNSNVIEHDKRKRNMHILECQLEEQPDNPYFLFCMGNEYFALGAVEKSLEYFNSAYEKCIKHDVYVPKLIIRIIMAYQMLGEYDKSMAYIDEALLLYPQYTDVEYLRGTIYHSLGVVTKAMASFQKCLSMGEPPSVLNFIIGVGSYKACYALGCIYNQMGDYSESLIHYNQSLLIKPDFYDAIYAIGEIIVKTSKNEDEIKNKLVQFFDLSSASSFAMLADILFLQRQYGLSLEFIIKAQEKGLETPELNFLRAQCLFYLKKYQSADTFFTQVASVYKFFKQRVSFHCLSLLLQQKFKEASDILETLIGEETNAIQYKTLTGLVSIFSTGEKIILDEDNGNSQLYLQIIFEILDMLLGAKEYEQFEKALELLNCIDNDSVLLMLAKLYNKHGYISMAKQEIMRSIKLFDKLDEESAFILYKICSIKA